MSPFDLAYEAARHNTWIGYYSVALFIGMATLVSFSFIQPPRIRRIAKLVSILIFSAMAYNFASLENEEKWRIRFAWVKAHPSEVSETDRFALHDRQAINGPFGPTYR